MAAGRALIARGNVVATAARDNSGPGVIGEPSSVVDTKDDPVAGARDGTRIDSPGPENAATRIAIRATARDETRQRDHARGDDGAIPLIGTSYDIAAGGHLDRPACRQGYASNYSK